MAENLTAEQVGELLAAMVGEQVWSPKLGVGSFLTLEVGERTPGAAHGPFHVWLYCCAWRLDDGEAVRVASEDDREVIAAAIADLDGRVVEAVELPDPAGAGLRLSFDGGLRLTTFAVFSRDFEHWMVYLPTGQVLTAGPGSDYRTEAATGGDR